MSTEKPISNRVRDEIRRLWGTGNLSAAQIGARFGLTNRERWNENLPTLHDRCDALNAALDWVLAETADVIARNRLVILPP